jgi:hypothetical protein
MIIASRERKIIAGGRKDHRCNIGNPRLPRSREIVAGKSPRKRTYVVVIRSDGSAQQNDRAFRGKNADV